MLKTAFQVLVLLASMQSATTPLRTGDVARKLTEQDVAALEMVLPSGAKPWLLDGDPGQAPGLEYTAAYLPPTNTSPVLRRGMVVTVVRRTRPLAETEWTVAETRSYAQVAIPGRSFDQIEGDQDTNRPFRVFGRFDDDELVTLVKFLRSNPPTRGPERIQLWPLLTIQRKADDSVEVMLRGGVGQGQGITLRQAGQDWVIVIVGMWIA
jgi:hypothetical protein